MPLFVACKLPHGLEIRHNGAVVRLNGPNEGIDLSDPGKNGAERDSDGSYAGYGFTELNDKDAKVYKDWAAAVTFKDGDKAKGKLDEPFAAIENGALMDFATKAAARDEVKTMGSTVTTGFEGVDPKKAGVEKMDDK